MRIEFLSERDYGNYYYRIKKEYGGFVPYYCETMLNCIWEAEELGLSINITDCIDILEKNYGENLKRMRDDTIAKKIMILLARNLHKYPLAFMLTTENLDNFIADWRVEK